MNFLFPKGKDSSDTFRPRKDIKKGNPLYDLKIKSEETLESGDLREAVKLPKDEDTNEWIAMHTVEFFNQTNMLYGTIHEFCTTESCPKMTAGPKYEYVWADKQRTIKCAAPEYVDYLMTWVQGQLYDESIFPSKVGVPFPPNFLQIAKTILRRLFRVYAHIYHSHWAPILKLQASAHLNTSFKHFIFFVLEFKLIDSKELAPMQDLIDKYTSSDGRIEGPAPEETAADPGVKVDPGVKADAGAAASSEADASSGAAASAP